MFLADADQAPANYLPLIVGGAIVAVALLLGLRDVLRFSISRTWAISGVCFQEALRRRVLWIAPLAMLGVLVVCQLQRPVDDQDTIRLTVKYCLFAAGTVVMLTMIILACTNLPREIDSRVIYTVVTKPTTRLEIILGKVLGMARICAALLALMGVFTWAYLEIRSAQLVGHIRDELATLTWNESARATLEHYRGHGLLHANTYAQPQNVQAYAELPQPDDTTRWVFGDSEQDILVPFDLPSGVLVDEGAAPDPKAILIIEPHIQTRTFAHGRQLWEIVSEQRADLPVPVVREVTEPLSPFPLDLPGFKPAPGPPHALVHLLGPDLFNLVAEGEIDGNYFKLPRDPRDHPIFISSVKLERLRPFNAPTKRVFVRVVGLAGDSEYGVDMTPPPVTLYSPRLGRTILPAVDAQGKPLPLLFRGAIGVRGEQLRGGEEGRFRTPVAVYAFRDVAPPAEHDGLVDFELRTNVQRSGSLARTDKEDVTLLSIRAADPKTGITTSPVHVPIESSRLAFFSLPAAAVRNGNFDLVVQCVTTGHNIGLAFDAVAMATAEQSFAFNLTKGLLVVWLMGVLVAAIALCCSTFLSWPVAVVLTAVVLMAHWGVSELGDYSEPGIGHKVASDLFHGSGAAEQELVSSTVTALTKMLVTVAGVLPDIQKFSSGEALERSQAVPPDVLAAALREALGFGLPIMAMAYVFLRYKEVAP